MKALLNILDTERGNQIANEMRDVYLERYDVIDFKHDGTLFEYPGIKEACKISLNDNQPVLYIHTKGATNYNGYQRMVRTMWSNEFVGDYKYYWNNKSGLIVPIVSEDLGCTYFNAWIIYPDVAKIYYENMELVTDRWYYESLPLYLKINTTDYIHAKYIQDVKGCFKTMELLAGTLIKVKRNENSSHSASHDICE